MKVKFINRNSFLNLRHYETRWSVTDSDGAEIQAGVLPPVPCAPGRSAEIRIPVAPISHPRPGEEFWLRVSLHTTASSLWATAGFEVAWQQMRLAVKTPPPPADAPARWPPVHLTQNGDQVTVQGTNFSAGFSRAAGTLVSLEYGGRKILASSTNDPAGPVLQMNRAPTDNDKGFGHWLARDWQDAGLAQATRRVDSFQVLKPGAPNEVRLQTVATSSAAHGGYTLKTTWTIRGDGAVDMENEFQPFGRQPATLPRIGVMLLLNGALENLQWLGRGPWENYADRRQSADLGVWTSTVADQYVPYVRPQENGNKEDTRWLTLTDVAGAGLRVEAVGASLAFSALHFSAADLMAVKHSYQLTPRREVVLSLDARQCGLGNGSCGPGVLQEYAVPPTNYSLNLRFRPVAPGR